VGALSGLGRLVAEDFDDWRRLTLADLQYEHLDTARLITVGLLGLTIGVLVARSALARTARRDRLALPAILGWVGPSRFASLRHTPLLLFALGLPWFVLALAAPYTALTRTEVSFPGRRIGLIIDASASMNSKFYADQLKRDPQDQNAFFTTVAAAQLFVHERMKGRYRDLISLVEFGDEAYVVTPFTNDYDNILLSLALIGDPAEFRSFPDKGTTIGLAIDQSVSLFRAFDFLNAAGNVMVVFSDGQDTQATIRGTEQSVAGAIGAHVPVYFIRTNYDRALGEIIPDRLWKPAVEKTGGRFYAASDEATILRAIHEIDHLATGRIETRQYSTETPRFTSFGLFAVALWTCALVLKLGVPSFNKFP
jgi:Ca-activated chloride channel family protein